MTFVRRKVNKKTGKVYLSLEKRERRGKSIISIFIRSLSPSTAAFVERQNPRGVIDWEAIHAQELERMAKADAEFHAHREKVAAELQTSSLGDPYGRPPTEAIEKPASNPLAEAKDKAADAAAPSSEAAGESAKGEGDTGGESEGK